MKKLFFISALLIFCVSYSMVSCHHKSDKPDRAIEQTLLTQIDEFSASVNQLISDLQSPVANSNLLQTHFLASRIAYKKFEWAAEYFQPATARLLNGPPVIEVEMPRQQLLDPAGLQVIEGILFPSYDSSRKRELVNQLNLLLTNTERYKIYFASNKLSDGQIFDAAKLEVFRIITLGIVGFDNPLTLKSMEESVSALESLQAVLQHYAKDSGVLIGKLDSAIKYLKDHPDFNSFNRMEFITAYANPVSIGIADLQDQLKVKVTRYNRLLNQDAKTLFDSNAFNVNAYAPDRSSFISNDKVQLGQKLFADATLSGSGKRSCQSCHQPAHAFTDGLVKNTILGQQELLERNTPTLINAALQPSLFYDLRVNSLEEQSVNVMQSSSEMHGSLKMSVKRLWNDTAYRAMFLKAFPNEDVTRIDTFEVMNAIGSYVRSLVLLNSRFDEYMRGDHSKMNTEEVNGFNLFAGKAKCATCHYLPLFNGTFPPRFIKIESEVIGVPKTKETREIDPDLGRYRVIKMNSFKHAFKTSTVRNTALTAPYMHNGVFSTLEDVMDFYNRGGAMGLGIKLDNQTLPSDSLKLSGKEQQDIIAFIKTLNSKISF